TLPSGPAMSGDGMFWLELAPRMAVTAAFLVAATAVAERAGPFLGGLVATLPISAGPVYLFLSLDHDVHFVAASALASLVANAVTGLFALVYILVAQVRAPVPQRLVSAAAAALVRRAAARHARCRAGRDRDRPEHAGRADADGNARSVSGGPLELDPALSPAAGRAGARRDPRQHSPGSRRLRGRGARVASSRRAARKTRGARARSPDLDRLEPDALGKPPPRLVRLFALRGLALERIERLERRARGGLVRIGRRGRGELVRIERGDLG